MNPAELIITAGVMLGVALPLTAVVEATQAPADMQRYVMSENCPNSKVCLVDVKTNRYLGEDMEPKTLLQAKG